MLVAILSTPLVFSHQMAALFKYCDASRDLVTFEFSIQTCISRGRLSHQLCRKQQQSRQDYIDEIFDVFDSRHVHVCMVYMYTVYAWYNIETRYI